MDTEIVGTMQINGKVVCAYNKDGEAIYLAPGWDLVNGSLVQLPELDVSKMN